MSSWLQSLRTVLGFGPTTVTLYPIVVRPATVVGRRLERGPEMFPRASSRYEYYDAAVELLLGSGFKQNSLVRFSTLDGDGYLQERLDFAGVPLVGLGVSARSYAPNVHYECQASRGQATVAEAMKAYFDYPYTSRTKATYGFRLNAEERRRRYVLLSLSLGYVSGSGYQSTFGRRLHDDFSAEIAFLAELGLVVWDSADAELRLTRDGFRYSSAIGAFMSSQAVLDRERGSD
jgi:oxygen-independent coproporphyrinogen-3 oxidase